MSIGRKQLKVWCLAPVFLVVTAFLDLNGQDISRILNDKYGAERLKEDPVDYVNPAIGGISHTLQPTRPTVQLPGSMIRILPVFSPGVNDVYLASRIHGFSFNIPSHRGRAVSTIMARKRNVDETAGYNGSHFDHDFEIMTPYYYSVLLEDEQIIAEYTPTERAVFFTFKNLDDGPVELLLRFRNLAHIEVMNKQTIAGYEEMRGMRQYFVLQIDRTPKGFFSGEGRIRESMEGERLEITIPFESLSVDIIKAKIAISYIDTDQAADNLSREIPHWDFEKTKTEARRAWNDMLGKIEVSGGSEDDKTVFYTALHRCFERMVHTTEYGRYYSAYDGRVHRDERPFYVDDWVWDSYRSHHPLKLLLVPEAEQDMIASYIRMYEQSGWMPSFPQVYGDGKAMIGHHQAALIADAWSKGFRDFDMDKAYEGLVKNAMEGTMIPWREGPATRLDDFYRKKGYFPALAPDEEETVEEVHGFENRQAVAVTLEHAYDDWCLAQLAAEMDKQEDRERFEKRALNYRHVYNPETGFMSPKKENGAWVEPFDPKLSGGVGGRQYFAEMNSWTYTWFVPHDIPGLMELMGGRSTFIKRLDRMFEEDLGTSKWVFLGQFPDATGLVGQHAMGNEQGFHIPYLYAAAGEPWKTQKRVRQLMDAWFRNDPMGICGDEDGGGLSSWFVFSAMGFYPVCPGNPVYYLGSPLFEKTVIHMENGKDLVIMAENVSDQNKYIQEARINGKPLNQSWFEHQSIQNGGILHLKMGPRPDKDR